MSWVSRLVNTFRASRVDRDLDEELRFHLEERSGDLMRRGLDRDKANAQALRELGAPLRHREASRESKLVPWLESVWQDASYAIRNLGRQPAFTAVGLIVLATVVGLNTSLFTLTAGLLFRPWAGVGDPARVVTMYPVDSSGRTGGGFSLAAFRFLAAQTKSLAGAAAIRPEDVDLGLEGALGRTGAFLVSSSFFDVLGMVMAHGRGFRPEEDRPGMPQAVVVLGFSLWETRFGSDPGIVGRSVRVNDVPFTIVGIAPPEFVGPQPGRANLFLPIASVSLLHPNDPSVPSFLYKPDDCCSDVVGRLAPDATREQARAELDLLSRQFQSQAGTEVWLILVTGTEFLARPGRKNQILAIVGVCDLLRVKAARLIGQPRLSCDTFVSSPFPSRFGRRHGTGGCR